METITTFFRIALSGLFVLVGLNAGFSQHQNQGVETPVTKSSTYIIEISPEFREKNTGALRFGASDPNILFSAVNPVDNSMPLLVELKIPEGTPISSIIEIEMEMETGRPLWHVTVADILGNSEQNDVSFRPAGPPSGNHDHSTSIVVPPHIGGGTPGGGQYSATPKFPVSLYPNPATDQIHIVTEGEILWGVTEILDITGKKMGEWPIGAASDRATIDVSSLRPGIYIVRFRTDKETFAKKFQVSR
jgi:hypothetical protein